MAIPTVQARQIYSQQLIAKWDELKDLTPKTFLGSFFEKKISPTKYVSTEVRRGTEKIAADVFRGSDGDRVSISKSTEKIILPAYYKRYVDISDTQNYELIWGTMVSDVSAQILTSVIENVLDGVNEIKKTIERAYELQRAQIFESGIVQLNASDNIDFRRKGASVVDLGAAGYWNNPDVNPMESFKNAGNYMRQTAKCTDATFNVIMGDMAFMAFIQNKYVNDKEFNPNVKLMDLGLPQMNSEGAAFHGIYSAGAYKFNIWTYPEGYENIVGTFVKYINDNYAIFLPTTSGKFVMSYGAVPMAFKTGMADMPETIGLQAGDYIVRSYIDQKQLKHVNEVQSAGLAVPVSVDKIYTLTAYGAAAPISA